MEMPDRDGVVVAADRDSTHAESRDVILFIEVALVQAVGDAGEAASSLSTSFRWPQRPRARIPR
jgi:hypothetical protein